MPHPIQCSCGSLRGTVDCSDGVNRCVCYCADCQAFARFLQRESEILDAAGGTDIMQTAPENMTFVAGLEHLACMRLTPDGLLRWYAACCNTPVGNTPPRFKIPFVGLIHTFVNPGGGSLDDRFGPVRMRVHPRHARGAEKPRSMGRWMGLSAGVLRLASMILRARFTGGYRRTPFFDPATGAPVVVPKVLGPEELGALKARG